jgi:Fe2+ transport system protein FeoA
VQPLITLSTLKIGKQVLIENINASYEKKIRLLGLGISTGLWVFVLRNRGGDMVLASGNARIGIGKTLSALIQVREI